MPETPWISPYKIEPEADTDYLTVITYIPLTSYLKFPTFFKHAGLIQEQLHKSNGLIGFKIRADILTKNTYTISVWQDIKSYRDFVNSGNHKEIMDQEPEYLGENRKFVTVFIKGSEFPPSWQWALSKLKEH